MCTGSASTDSSNYGLKIPEKKSYIIADMYYVIRLMIVAFMLKMYRLFSFHYSLNNMA